MHNLSYEVGASIYDNFSQLDKKAKIFGKKLRAFAKFFCVLCLYVFFNIVVAVLFNVRKSMSIETFRFVMDGVRGLASQDLFFYLLLFYQSKVNYVTVAIALVCSVSLFAVVICAHCDKSSCRAIRRAFKNVSMRYDCDAPVISYKFNVAFRA